MFLMGIATVTFLQIVMVSPGTHLVKTHESQSRTIESQFKNNQSLVLSCDHAVNLKTPSIVKHNKD